jgi:N-acetylglucosamine kinase-like BadF-type ATPase
VRLFGGVDGGQSGARAVVGDESGRVLASAQGGPLFAPGGTLDADALGALADLLAGARARAGLGAVPFAAVVAGVSGHDDARDVPAHPSLAARVLVLHDTAVAHAGALDGDDGIVVIAGTGSVAIGSDDAGHRVRRGGWGFLFGDEGSAVWIAREAIAAAMRDADDGDAETPLARAACAHFAVPSLRALQHAVRGGAIPPERLATFAKVVLAAASEGVAAANDVRAAAVRALAALAAGVDRRLDAPAYGERRAVSWAGSLFADVAFGDAFATAVRSALPHARVAAPAGDPALGALLLARRSGEGAQ